MINATMTSLYCNDNGVVHNGVTVTPCNQDDLGASFVLLLTEPVCFSLSKRATTTKCPYITAYSYVSAFPERLAPNTTPKMVDYKVHCALIYEPALASKCDWSNAFGLLVLITLDGDKVLVGHDNPTPSFRPAKCWCLYQPVFLTKNWFFGC